MTTTAQNLEHQNADSDCNSNSYTKFWIKEKCVHGLNNHCYQLLCDICEEDVEI